MKADEAKQDKKAATDEENQDKDRNMNEEGPPSPLGGDSGTKGGSKTWDVTKAKESAEQVLELFPDMTGAGHGPYWKWSAAITLAIQKRPRLLLLTHRRLLYFFFNENKRYI
jgi:hypothetical protein